MFGVGEVQGFQATNCPSRVNERQRKVLELISGLHPFPLLFPVRLPRTATGDFSAAQPSSSCVLEAILSSGALLPPFHVEEGGGQGARDEKAVEWMLGLVYDLVGLVRAIIQTGYARSAFLLIASFLPPPRLLFVVFLKTASRSGLCCWQSEENWAI